MVDKIVQEIRNLEEQIIFIGHGDCEEEAIKLQEMIKEHLQVKGFVINFIDIVIAAHAGPGTLAVFYKGEHR